MEPIQMIEGKISRIANEIEAARTKALAASTIDPKTGAVKVASDSPELKRISEMEKTAARLEAIRSEIAGLYETAGVESREQLGTLRNQAEADIAGGPLEAWKHFRMFHELPTANGGFSDLLPSDLCQVEPYQAIEREQRARMDGARAILEKTNPVMAQLHALTAEANSL